MQWLSVLAESELPEGARHVVKIQDHSILLLRNKGKIYATVSACPHMGLPLKNGVVTEDDALVCPFHHSAFDLGTGDVKAWSPWPPLVGRMLASVTREKTLHVFPTRVEEGMIWLGLDL